MFKQALANAKLLIVILTMLLLVSIVSNLFFGKQLANTAAHPVIHIDGAIPATGLDVKAGTIPLHTVYLFAFYVWSGLQTWQTNGKTDLANNIKGFNSYLTPDFYNQMVSYARDADNKGLLQGHQQFLVNAGASVFNSTDVKALGHGVWLVHLTLRLVNRISDTNHPNSFAKSFIAEDAKISYVFRVVVPTTPVPNNRWGLQLAGFATSPKTLEVYST